MKSTEEEGTLCVQSHMIQMKEWGVLVWGGLREKTETMFSKDTEAGTGCPDGAIQSSTDTL